MRLKRELLQSSKKKEAKNFLKPYMSHRIDPPYCVRLWVAFDATHAFEESSFGICYTESVCVTDLQLKSASEAFNFLLVSVSERDSNPRYRRPWSRPQTDSFECTKKPRNSQMFQLASLFDFPLPGLFNPVNLFGFKTFQLNNCSSHCEFASRRLAKFTV